MKMNKLLPIFVIVLSVILNVLCYNNINTKSEFDLLHYELIDEEQKRSFGSEIELNENELKANDIIMKIKHEEIDRGFLNPDNYTANHHYFNRYDQIEKSELFQILKKMPKGGVLHAHDSGMMTPDFFLSVTHWDNLWSCKSGTRTSFKFATIQPVDELSDCDYVNVADQRKQQGEVSFDEDMIKNFQFNTDNPYVEYPNNQIAWDKFFGVFRSCKSLLAYRLVWEEYFRQALKNYYDDGVRYLEIRGNPVEVFFKPSSRRFFNLIIIINNFSCMI